MNRGNGVDQNLTSVLFQSPSFFFFKYCLISDRNHVYRLNIYKIHDFEQVAEMLRGWVFASGG